MLFALGDACAVPPCCDQGREAAWRAGACNTGPGSGGVVCDRGVRVWLHAESPRGPKRRGVLCVRPRAHCATRDAKQVQGWPPSSTISKGGRGMAFDHRVWVYIPLRDARARRDAGAMSRGLAPRGRPLGRLPRPQTCGIKWRTDWLDCRSCMPALADAGRLVSIARGAGIPATRTDRPEMGFVEAPGCKRANDGFFWLLTVPLSQLGVGPEVSNNMSKLPLPRKRRMVELANANMRPIPEFRRPPQLHRWLRAAVPSGRRRGLVHVHGPLQDVQLLGRALPGLLVQGPRADHVICFGQRAFIRRLVSRTSAALGRVHIATWCVSILPTRSISQGM